MTDNNNNNSINNNKSKTNKNDEYHSKEIFLKEQDRVLPMANISRIMKQCIPKLGKVSKKSKECMQECVSEFICFVTSEYIIFI